MLGMQFLQPWYEVVLVGPRCSGSCSAQRSRGLKWAKRSRLPGQGHSGARRWGQFGSKAGPLDLDEGSGFQSESET